MSMMSRRAARPARWLQIVAFAACLGLPGLSLALGDGSHSATAKQGITQAACAFLEAAVTAPHDSIAVALDLPALPETGGGITDYSFELLSSKSPAGTVTLKITLFMKDILRKNLG